MADTVFVTNKGTAMIVDRVNAAATYTATPKFIAHGTGVHTAAKADTALTTEVTGDGRATGTATDQTTTNTGDTLQVVGTVTSAAGGTIVEAGLFDVVTSSSGNMFVTATFTGIALNAGDSIAYTFKVQITN